MWEAGWVGAPWFLREDVAGLCESLQGLAENWSQYSVMSGNSTWSCDPAKLLGSGTLFMGTEQGRECAVRPFETPRVSPRSPAAHYSGP